MQSTDTVKERWSADAVAFMRDACEYGAFHKELAEQIRPYLPADGHICEPGCGLGYLSAELAAFCRQVTAVDLSASAINFAKKRHNADNLNICCGSVYAMNDSYDAMVFCYFGRTHEILELAKKYCRGNTVILKRCCAEHRFSIGQTRSRHEPDDMISVLKENRVSFTHKLLTMEFGQPFVSLEAAVRFFAFYDKSGAEINTETVLPRLQEISHPVFRYYLPEKRTMDLIVFSATDL